MVDPVLCGLPVKNVGNERCDWSKSISAKPRPSVSNCFNRTAVNGSSNVLIFRGAVGNPL